MLLHDFDEQFGCYSDPVVGTVQADPNGVVLGEEEERGGGRCQSAARNVKDWQFSQRSEPRLGPTYCGRSLPAVGAGGLGSSIYMLAVFHLF